MTLRWALVLLTLPLMLMWWQRWNSDGTFCLLYAEDQAHCEIDGSRLVILPTTRY